MKQEITYLLIKHLHEKEGLGYRKISKKMNQWGIKTQRGKTWSNSSVHSVLKRRHQRDARIDNLRLKKYPSKLSDFKIEYLTRDRQPITMN